LHARFLSVYLYQAGRRRVLARLTVSLPAKHGRGGQSAARFGRARINARRDWCKRVAESAYQAFVKNADELIISSLILAGAADLKDDVSKKLDDKLKSVIVASVDTCYGGDAGFREVIVAAGDVLRQAGVQRERELMEDAFGKMALNPECVAVGQREVMAALEAGAAEKVLLAESEQSRAMSAACKISGAKLTAISDATSEGKQLAEGLGGFLALLRYPMQFEEVEEDLGEEQFDLNEYEI